MTRRKGRQPRPRRPEHERVWSVDDALRLYTKLVEWLPTRDGVKACYLAYHLSYRGSWPPELAEESARWELAEQTARESATTIGSTSLIWCDPPMTDLIAAAADTYPPEPFLEHNLPSPHGIVIFAKPLPAVWQDQYAETERRELSAITWATGLSTDDRQTLSIAGWEPRTGIDRYRDPDLTIYYSGLRLASYVLGLYGATPEDQGGPAGTNRILQTFAALSRTPLVRDESAPGSKAARQAAARAGLQDRPIRRVYLRRPQDGPAELEAARAERAGRPPRAHWVRGHWKDQWYPSIEEHRTIWVSGYPRGDFSAGTVGGTKVLVATDRQGDTPSQSA